MLASEAIANNGLVYVVMVGFVYLSRENRKLLGRTRGIFLILGGHLARIPFLAVAIQIQHFGNHGGHLGLAETFCFPSVRVWPISLLGGFPFILVDSGGGGRWGFFDQVGLTGRKCVGLLKARPFREQEQSGRRHGDGDRRFVALVARGVGLNHG